MRDLKLKHGHSGGFWTIEVLEQQFPFMGNQNLTGDFFEEWNEITPQTHIRKFEEQMA